MDVLERMFENSFHKIIAVNEMQFSFIPEKGTISAVFILSILQKACHATEKKLSFADIEKAFDRVLRKMLECVMMKM